MLTRLGAIFLLSCALLACEVNEAKQRVDQAASEGLDPADFSLNTLSDSIRFQVLEGGLQVGIITLKSGEEIKFWFCSHHCAKGPSWTRFELPDGEVRYLSGQFCCEVQIADESLSDLDAFQAMLDMLLADQAS